MTGTSVSNSIKELKGRHVLFWLLGFFGLMFTVNGIFLFHAITSFPGEDVKKSYLQGLSYNETLAKRAEQANLGWHMAMGVDGDRLVVQILDRNGTPLSGRSVAAEVRRRATTGEDREFNLTPRSNGTYEVNVSGLQMGQWEIKAYVWGENGDDLVFVARKLVTIR
jgi:nitrogen fixation protein FixH